MIETKKSIEEIMQEIRVIRKAHIDGRKCCCSWTYSTEPNPLNWCQEFDSILAEAFRKVKNDK